MRAVITSSYYTLNPFMVHWMGRWEDGRKLRYSFQPPFNPYFYYEADSGKIVKKEPVPHIPPQVAKDRELYRKTYEADLVFTERVLIDMGIRKGVEIFDPNIADLANNYRPADYKGIELRKSYIDIETDDTMRIDLENPKGEVLSIAMRDSFKRLTVILTTIPEQKINTRKLMELLRNENDKIRHALKERGLDRLLKHVGNMDLKVISKSSEKDMLTTYRNYLHSDSVADIQSGYNINGFDLQYLQHRTENILKTNLGYRFHRGSYGDWWASHNMTTNLDLFFAYMRLQENDMNSFSLESVSQRELGIGKIKHSMGFREMYEKEPEMFLVYNYRDTLLCHLLDMKLGISDFFLMLSNKAGTLDAGKWAATYLVDTLLFRKTHNNTDFRIPTAGMHEKIKVEGGKVMEAVMGVFRNVVVFDFKHLYPNIMVQFNISPDTLLLDDQITEKDIFIGVFDGHRVGYRKDKIGIIPLTIVELVEERYTIKGRMKQYPRESDEYIMLNDEQRAVKEVDNSFYGVRGNEHARLFNPYDQASITYVAREDLAFVADYIENLLKVESQKQWTSELMGRLLSEGFRVLYGDTDSVFIWNPEWQDMSPEEVVSDAKVLAKIINDQFVDFVKRFNAPTDKIVLEMEFEKLYSVWEQWGGQKQYAGFIAWKDGKFLEQPYFDVKGFDPRRSDRSIYGSEYFMPKFLQLPLEDRDKALAFYDEESEKWENHDIDPAMIGIFFSLNKEEYREGRNGSSYMPKRAYDNAIKKGIKLDRMKGKFRMYFLKDPIPDDVIAINYDDPVPKSILAKLDWAYHRERCLDVEVVKTIMKNLRPTVNTDSYEVDE